MVNNVEDRIVGFASLAFICFLMFLLGLVFFKSNLPNSPVTLNHTNIHANHTNSHVNHTNSEKLTENAIVYFSFTALGKNFV